MSEILDIVDEKDNVIWTNTRHESYRNCTRNRIVFVVLKNITGQIYLQRRSNTCWFCPWALDITAWWHVSSWQDYEEAAYREMFEEVWVKWIDLTFHSKWAWDRYEIDKKYQKNSNHMREHSHEFFREIYTWVYDWDFSFDDWEVEEVLLFSKDELQKLIDNNEFMTPGCIDVLTEYFL